MMMKGRRKIMKAMVVKLKYEQVEKKVNEVSVG